jgi:hypothetical protein
MLRPFTQLYPNQAIGAKIRFSNETSEARFASMLKSKIAKTSQMPMLIAF